MYNVGSPEFSIACCYGNICQRPTYAVHNYGVNKPALLLLERYFLRHVRTLCVALRAARNSPVHSNGVINYAIAVRLFRTVLRDRLKNFSRYNSVVLLLCCLALIFFFLLQNN